MNFATATAAELIAAFNTAAIDLGTPQVKRFADRATAEKRTAAIVAKRDLLAADLFAAGFPAVAPEVTEPVITEPVAAEATTRGCPKCGNTTDLTAGRVVERNGHQDVVEEHISQCHGCGHTFHSVTLKPVKFANERKRGDSAAAIASSWADPEVRAARLQRTEVNVVRDGKAVGAFKSVPAAFRELRLGTGFHRTRLEVKAAGSYTHAGYTFIEVKTTSV